MQKWCRRRGGKNKTNEGDDSPKSRRTPQQTLLSGPSPASVSLVGSAPCSPCSGLAPVGEAQEARLDTHLGEATRELWRDAHRNTAGTGDGNTVEFADAPENPGTYFGTSGYTQIANAAGACGNYNQRDIVAPGADKGHRREAAIVGFLVFSLASIAAVWRLGPQWQWPGLGNPQMVAFLRSAHTTMTTTELRWEFEATGLTTTNALASPLDAATGTAAETHKVTTTTRGELARVRLRIQRQVPNLYCLSVMQPGTYEEELIKRQLALGAGIFACNEFAVFSNDNIALGAGHAVGVSHTVHAIAINASLDSSNGVVEHILNAEIFMRAWDKVRSNTVRKHDWFVKVDPDAIFFAARLRSNLLDLQNRSGARPSDRLYLLNCNMSFGFFGSLEVFSRGAIQTYQRGLEHCKSNLTWSKWGEDLFMRRCLDLLGVTRAKDYSMLADAYCGKALALRSGCGSFEAAAYHPFKDVFDFFNCYTQADPHAPLPDDLRGLAAAAKLAAQTTAPLAAPPQAPPAALPPVAPPGRPLASQPPPAALALAAPPSGEELF